MQTAQPEKLVDSSTLKTLFRWVDGDEKYTKKKRKKSLTWKNEVK